MSSWVSSCRSGHRGARAARTRSSPEPWSRTACGGTRCARPDRRPCPTTRRPRTRCTAAHRRRRSRECPRGWPGSRAPRAGARRPCRRRAAVRSWSLAMNTRPPAVATGPFFGRTLPVPVMPLAASPGDVAVGDAPLHRAVVQVVGDELRERRPGRGQAVARVPAGRERAGVAHLGSLIARRIRRQPQRRVLRRRGRRRRTCPASADRLRARRGARPGRTASGNAGICGLSLPDQLPEVLRAQRRR